MRSSIFPSSVGEALKPRHLRPPKLLYRVTAPQTGSTVQPSLRAMPLSERGCLTKQPSVHPTLPEAWTLQLNWTAVGPMVEARLASGCLSWLWNHISVYSGSPFGDQRSCSHQRSPTCLASHGRNFPVDTPLPGRWEPRQTARPLTLVCAEVGHQSTRGRCTQARISTFVML